MIAVCASRSFGKFFIAMQAATHIHVKGAREHNLQNLELRIPRGKLVVVTGPSGSGKSSPASPNRLT